MASLRKFPRSPFWFACFTLPDGRRVQRSTKESKRKQAQEKADEWERLSKERAKARQAHRVIADIYRAAHKEELPDATTSTFVEGWLTRRKGEVSPATFAAYSNRARHFLGWLALMATRPLAELEPRHIIGYRDALAENVSPSTVNHGIKLLRVIFEDARRDGFVAENPAKDCGMLKRDGANARRPFTLNELRSVLGVAGGEWRSMIFFGLYTGQRLSDVARLTWANLDLQAGEVHLRTAKTGRRVRIPICQPLMAHIETLPVGDDPKAHIHPKAAATLRINSSTLSRQFGELLSSAGLVERKPHQASEIGSRGRATRRAPSVLSFHSLRHTATSLMKNAGISPAVVQDIIGHDSAEVSAHYTHIESAAKRQALAALPSLLPEPPPKRRAGR